MEGRRRASWGRGGRPPGRAGRRPSQPPPTARREGREDRHAVAEEARRAGRPARAPPARPRRRSRTRATSAAVTTTQTTRAYCMKATMRGSAPNSSAMATMAEAPPGEEPQAAEEPGRDPKRPRSQATTAPATMVDSDDEQHGRPVAQHGGDDVGRDRARDQAADDALREQEGRPRHPDGRAAGAEQRCRRASARAGGRPGRGRARGAPDEDERRPARPRPLRDRAACVHGSRASAVLVAAPIRLWPAIPVRSPRMFPKPRPSLAPNTAAFESLPLVKPTGFREYDARWWFGHPGSDKPPELNLMGVQALGMGLGTLLGRMGVRAGDRHRARFPRLFVGHQVRADRRA